MSKYPDVLFQPHHTQLLEFFFLFSLKVLDGNEPLPKGAAAEFWVSLTLFLSPDYLPSPITLSYHSPSTPFITLHPFPLLRTHTIPNHLPHTHPTPTMD